MRHLFLSGHGGWKPEYGYATVPRGVSVYFYTHFAKTLMTSMEKLILTGAYTTTDRIVGELSQCPNMQISGQPDAWTTASEAHLNKAYWGDESMVLGVPEGEKGRLADFFAMASGAMAQGDKVAIHWIACSTLQLKQVGGRSIGLNADDYRHDTRKGHYRITNPDGTFRWI